MSQLDLVWQLESKNKKIKEYNNILLEERENLTTNNQIRINLLEEKPLKEINNMINETKDEIRRKSHLLNELLYDLEEKEKKLYSGETSDIKQLDYLNNERVEIEIKIDDLEVDILENMENLDKFEHEKDSRTNDLQQKIEGLDQESMNLNEKIKKIKDYIKKEKETKLEIEEVLEKDLLKEYEKISKRKSMPVAGVENKTCAGCRMIVSDLIIDKLKNTNEIIRCENCGRILYLI